MIYERIFREFQRIGLRYAVIGGIAVNLHGYNRVTGDLDIIISFSDENISKFIEVSKQLDLVSRLPVKLEDLAKSELRLSWIQEKNMKVFTVYNPSNPLEHVDVKIDNSNDIEKFLNRAVLIKAADIVIPLVSIDDLIELKKQASRDRDLIDIKALERIKRLDE